MYIYSVGTKVDTITFLNWLSLSVLYNVLLKKLQSITISSTIFIKKQAYNCKLINIWKNFDYQKNVIREKIGNIIKFRSIIMIL